jgi:hypothetical protein
MVFPRHRRYSYKKWQHPAFAIRLRALLRGYQHQLARVNQAILEMRLQLGETYLPPAQAKPDAPQLSTTQLSTAVMKRIASARKGRRIEYKMRKPYHP